MTRIRLQGKYKYKHNDRWLKGYAIIVNGRVLLRLVGPSGSYTYESDTLTFSGGKREYAFSSIYALRRPLEAYFPYKLKKNKLYPECIVLRQRKRKKLHDELPF